MKLFRAIAGVAEMDEGQSVDDLKKAIKADKSNDFKHFVADKLQLFLAKKGDAWLPDDETMDAMLRSGDGPGYVREYPVVKNYWLCGSY
ncbi:hypothetical protein PInf_016969 [Phytophthora infestans]|nr:hypothetical protein PInf_016969 [Phytophthora infestans]